METNPITTNPDSREQLKKLIYCCEYVIALDSRTSELICIYKKIDYNHFSIIHAFSRSGRYGYIFVRLLGNDTIIDKDHFYHSLFTVQSDLLRISFDKDGFYRFLLERELLADWLEYELLGDKK